jgi:uncharacterized protein (TIGR00369 family)
MLRTAMTETKIESVFDRFPTPPCAQLLGWRLVAQDIERGWVRIEFDAKPEFLNPAGFIQGGILAAMLDDTMGPAALVKSQGKTFTSTIDMNVSYMSAARPGKLYGEGQVIQLGKTIGYLEAKLLDANGALIARATSSARLVSAEPMQT